ncbi:MAG: hypothetical protein K2J90_05405 [Lachnospiraceae bacterium]|nr:hypothetical protein [Lachnospiraceae bacterium]
MTLPRAENYKLISIDIFDTLLLRAVAKPIDLFEFVWEEAERRDIAKISMYPKEYVKFRVEMERRARIGKPNREVTLEDIYQMYPDYIASDTNQLKELEVELEKKYCYPNFVILDWLRAVKEKGCILVLVSDMYLSSKIIRDILAVNEIELSMFDDIIVSNEYGCNKQNGELFDVLFEKYPDIQAVDMLHIGDNKNADYDQPLKRGMCAFHYNAIPDKLYSIFDYEKIRHNVPQPGILSLRKMCIEASSYEGREKTAYELGAGVTGPVLSLYISWVCRRLQKLNITRIYPLMREGYLLGELLKKEAQNIGLELEVHPIYVSRKVTYIPSITKVNREEIENMIGARNLTIRESFHLMGLDEHDFLEIKEYFDVRHKESHKIAYGGETLKEYIISRFLEEKNVKQIECYIEEERRKLVTYLKQEIGDMNQIATIDIGFFGRIQMWMEKCLDIEKVPHKMKHFLAVGVTEDRLYNGLDFEGMFSTFGENRDLIPTIHRTTDVLEKLISVTEGSTIGYQEQNGRIVPLQAAGVDNEDLTKIAFEGAFAFQKYWFQFCQMKPELAEICLADRRETLMILHRLIDMPRKEEAKLLADFEADTNFGTNYKRGIITKEHLALAEEKGVDFIDKCNVSYTYQNSNITWPKGTVTLVDEFYYVRRALKNGSRNEIIKSMQEVVEQVQSDGVTEVALYGAGENGRQFYFLCQMYHIRVKCFIDRKESIWGTFKEGVEVMGLDEAMRRGNNIYIVTSLFSISEISDFILERYANLAYEPKIYSV